MLEMAKKWVNILNLFFKVKNKKVFFTGTNVPVGKDTFVPAGTFVPFGKGTFVPCIFPALSRPSTPLSMPLLTHTNPTYHPFAYMSHISTAMTLHTQAPPHPLTGYICTWHSLPRPHKLQTYPLAPPIFHAPIQLSSLTLFLSQPSPPPPSPIPNTERGGGGLWPVTCQSLWAYLLTSLATYMYIQDFYCFSSNPVASGLCCFSFQTF